MPRLISATILPVLALIAWQAGSTASPAAKSVLSSPVDVVAALLSSAASGQLLGNIGISLSRALGGWAAATLIAAPLGVLLARNRLARIILGPPLNVLRPISPVAWIPVAILWFGIGYGSKLFIVGIIAFFVVLANSFQAAAAIDPLLLKAARTFTRSRLKAGVHVVLPGSLHGIVIGAQFALASAWGGVIIAEYTGANSGIGYEMLYAANLFLPAEVMANMLVVAAVGYLLNAGFKLSLTTRGARKFLG
jgi:ABC-type nitrate/sulfonate/bicarbonate transport system permease component